MADMKHVCAYKHCIHHGEEVKRPNAVVINKKWYHKDCADMLKTIKKLTYMYTDYFDDTSRYPMAYHIITILATKNKVPLDYIYKMIKGHKKYYSERSVYALYGIRNMFWEKEMVRNVSSCGQGTNQQSQGETR